MKDATARLLTYAKEFYLSGERELDQQTNFALMQAVLKFHDAVEYCVRAVVEEHAVSHNRNAGLLPLMKSVDKAIPSKKLPLASQVDFLNATRGKIKHHASVPSLDDTQRCRIHARDFLDQTASDYLGVEFASVSRLLLIEDLVVRGHLQAADERRLQGDYLEAMIEVKKAFHLARPSERTFMSEHAPFRHGLSISGFADIQEIRRPLEEMLRRISELEDQVSLVMMGVDVLQLRRFEEITPHFEFYFNGTCSILWDDSLALTAEIVQEAQAYVVDMTLIWQRMGVVGNRPDWPQFRHRPWRVLREEDWHYANQPPDAAKEP